MPDVHFTNLLVVAGAGLLAPLALGFLPRLRIPAIVLEIVLGIVIGPAVLGWVTPDLPVAILALVGLAFLLFLAGLELDVERRAAFVFRVKLEAAGFGVFIPIFFVTSGMRFDLNALFASASTVARVPCSWPRSTSPAACPRLCTYRCSGVPGR